MANVFSGITDYLSGGALNKGLSATDQAAHVAAATQVPDLTTLIPQLQKQVQQGTMTAAEAEAAIQQASALNGLSTAPTADQLEAMQAQKQIATQGGMTDIDKAQLLDMQNQIGNKNAAEQSAIQDQAAQRGLGTSGSSMASRLVQAQGNANSMNQQGATVAANAQARAIQALSNFGNQANTLQTNQFNQEAQKATAQDAINAFNAKNQTATNVSNAANDQAANAANFNTANNIAGTNTTIANTQAMMPYNAGQQNFTNNLNRNANVTNALNAQATNLINQGNQQAKDSAAGTQAVVDGVVKYGPAVWNAASSYFSDENMKEVDKKPAGDDLDAMMDKLIGKRFKYKDDSVAADGGKTHIGPMAQDIQKAGLPVMDTPDGKLVVNNDEMKGIVLAMIARNHERLNDLEGK